METRAHHVLIGLFTVVVLTGAMLFVLWLAKTGPAENADVYDIVFRESVTGLTPGSRVLFNGIHVGTVESIQIDPVDPRKVIARVQVVGTTPVKRDTRAELILANITGATEILLSGGSPQSPSLKREGGVPEILAEPSRFAQLRDSATELLKDISGLVEKGNLLLSEENTAHLSRTLENLDKISGTLAGEGEEVRKGVQSLARVGREAERLLQRMNALVDNQGEALMTNAAQAMASLQRATANVDRLLGKNGEALAEGVQGLNSLGPTLEELRKTLTTLRDIARRFDEDPGTYLFRREPIREFQP